jgi:hypothetical protein
MHVLRPSANNTLRSAGIFVGAALLGVRMAVTHSTITASAGCCMYWSFQHSPTGLQAL